MTRRRIDEQTQKIIQRNLREGKSVRVTARNAWVSKTTVMKYKSPKPPSR